MNRKILCTKLEIKLILSIIFSFIIACTIFILLETIGESILDNHFSKNYFINNQKNTAISNFLKYVSDNKLKIDDKDKITEWVRKEKYVNLYIYKDNHLVYNSDINDATIYYGKTVENPLMPSGSLYEVKFGDTAAKMYMECFFQYKYYYIVSIFDGTIAFLSFILIMLIFIKRKTTYIGKLENELKILEGGNLNHEITISGKDELTSLAQGINEMRKSFIERLDSENKAYVANSELVTAMSHDLRTPLTALVGYLDIIEYKKYNTDESLRQYIHNSREKAYQIKYLSDKLFEYFTVFNTNADDLELETFDGNELLEQLVEEQIFILEDNGFNFKIVPCNTAFHIEVNLISIRRVFDNIFSNIIKYGDKRKPINIKYCIQDQLLTINIENKINNNLKAVSSTGIGLKTCKKIMEGHNGKIVAEKQNDIFSVEISLSIKS
ncbi:HAMP domain-containing histidine kinase [Clostridium sp. PL3]|uniref:histidine kinase n=1 Tax=Clostridium thailandense TaxID=2794346 RepID=A0A949X462_9CLOT|nr:HAMP domain-containing sensor histidine kinase [Clostridium thailandense]MBV7273483.1 HAMP domain-containing histidine kinase [Clostridium thailandense]